MNRRSRKHRENRLRHQNKQRLREYHDNHTIKRTNTRCGLILTTEDIEEVIGLIHKNRKETVKFVRKGKKKKDNALVYIVIFRDKALPLVYDPKKNWLITCLKLKWAFQGLSPEQINDLKEWLRERRLNQENIES